MSDTWPTTAPTTWPCARGIAVSKNRSSGTGASVCARACASCLCRARLPCVYMYVDDMAMTSVLVVRRTHSLRACWTVYVSIAYFFSLQETHADIQIHARTQLMVGNCTRHILQGARAAAHDAGRAPLLRRMRPPAHYNRAGTMTTIGAWPPSKYRRLSCLLFALKRRIKASSAHQHDRSTEESDADATRRCPLISPRIPEHVRATVLPSFSLHNNSHSHAPAAIPAPLGKQTVPCTQPRPIQMRKMAWPDTLLVGHKGASPPEILPVPVHGWHPRHAHGPMRAVCTH